jgi:hypothetical protein
MPFPFGFSTTLSLPQVRFQDPRLLLYRIERILTPSTHDFRHLEGGPAPTSGVEFPVSPKTVQWLRKAAVRVDWEGAQVTLTLRCVVNIALPANLVIWGFILATQMPGSVVVRGLLGTTVSALIVAVPWTLLRRATESWFVVLCRDMDDALAAA